ncbi:MAG: NAD(+)/NADH kinase [Desulfobulbaceae bacterium]|nr:NAD(+)/NADH kinase [Desulfobulbaceae bacterium]
MSDNFRVVKRLNPRRVGLIKKIDDADAGRFADELAVWLSERGAVVERDRIESGQDLLVVLGGDGTLLRIAERAAAHGIPVIGINMGSLGFLTELSVAEAKTALTRIFAEEVVIESRMMLRVGAGPGRAAYALNDIVINKNTTDRLLKLTTYAGGNLITTYRADGLIFSTPTGSTAYNLSAGGPLVYPGADCVIITPICPFMLSSRPIILPSSLTITSEFIGRGDDESAQVLVDGKHFVTMENGGILEIRAADHPLLLLAISERDYFSVLRGKLHWGNRDDEGATSL